MGEIDWNEAKNFAVEDLGFNEESAGHAAAIGEYAEKATTWIGWVVAAYELLKGWFEGPKPDPIRTIISKLNQVLAVQNVQDWNKYVEWATERATTILGAAQSAENYRSGPSVRTRDALGNRYEELKDALHLLLELYPFRFIPTVYENPDWADGRYAHYALYKERVPHISSEWYGWLYRFQVYQQLDESRYPLASQWALPQPLVEQSPRDDGLLCRDLAFYGLPVWLMALTQLEPFHQLTGHEADALKVMVDTIDDFWMGWLFLLMSTREMPSASEILPSDLTTQNLVAGEILRVSDDLPAPGFITWPCGVVDSMMGIEICNPQWWTCAGFFAGQSIPEMMTDEERAGFRQLRKRQFLTLLEKNLFTTFMKLRSAVDTRRKLPVDSPSLKVHPDLRQVVSSGRGYAAMPREEPVLVPDPGGTVWPGRSRQASVNVKAPISVQPNPNPGADEAQTDRSRRAQTDIVFGYMITVKPRGGDRHVNPVWNWPLRRRSPEPSLYHESVKDDQGYFTVRVRDLPYPTQYEFTRVPATTWVTVTDGVHRDEIDSAPGWVTFTMTVSVHDPLADPLSKIPFPAPEEPEEKIWNDQHGVIWITIKADANTNSYRSFEVVVEVTETTAVDEQGQPTDDNAKLKKYTVQMPIPVDISTIRVAPGYFDWLRRKAEEARHSYQLTPPGPGPGPGPREFELSDLRLILRQKSTLSQAHLNQLRRITNRPTLTPQQALGELDAFLARMATTSGPALTPGTAEAPEIRPTRRS